MNPLRPSMWSAYFLEDSPEEMAERFAAHGWRESELSSEHGEALLERGNPEAEGAAFRQRAADEGMAFPQGHLWLTCDAAAPDHGRTVDALKQWLDLFVAVGVEAAVLHPGGGALAESGAPPETIMDARVDALSALATHVDGSPLTICLENVGNAPFAADLNTLIDAVGSPHLGICLDTGHLHMAKGDQGAFIRDAGDRLKALHIADNDGSGDQHLLPYGRGTVDWADVIAGLRAIGYNGLLNLEVPGERRAPTPVSLAKLDYARTLIETMFADTAKLD